MRKIYIGTSGWNYSHWKGIFYPADCPMSKRLEFYTGQFATVEVNATFYRLLNPKTAENWYERTPSEFLWSVKASRYITHIKRLKDWAAKIKKWGRDTYVFYYQME